MNDLEKFQLALMKILFTGIVGAGLIIGLVILALSLKQCITIKQSQNVPRTEIQKDKP